ncbi:unnamed protein product [Adineta ricciae]|uniref:Sjoegren syndrome/scleroderma autoantigen 1 n=1 Tax=Adineta ricciae TaxID=249248 RepID=A0A814P6K6_ADIRI|nr:unnamed protein product [Adineta ricciae]CAF1103532.1 unnamed protein product [Adineta ricciae]
MNKNQATGHSTAKHETDEDFEWMVDSPKENPVLAEQRRVRENEITKKLGEYLLKGYCMLGDTCPECNCILLRTPERELLCVGCSEIDANSKKSESEDATTVTTSKKKKHSKKQKNKKEANETISHCDQLESKLKWAVDELTKSQNATRINEMCSVILKLTETIKALKKHEQDEN